MKIIRVKTYKDIPEDFTGIVELADGTKYWFLNGNFHRDREDGPTVELADGTKIWHRNGKFHRDNGPAIEYPNGEKCWFLNDISYSKEEYFNALSPEQRLKFIYSDYF
jgi:hypothetical protein